MQQASSASSSSLPERRDVFLAGCQSCHGETSSCLVSLESCQHLVHYACATNSAANSSAKRTRPSTFGCPVCQAPLSWLDHAKGVSDRRQFLEIDLGRDDQVGLGKALDALDAAWTKMQVVKSTTPAKKKQVRL
jgi:hypothetical protein